MKPFVCCLSLYLFDLSGWEKWKGDWYWSYSWACKSFDYERIKESFSAHDGGSARIYLYVAKILKKGAFVESAESELVESFSIRIYLLDLFIFLEYISFYSRRWTKWSSTRSTIRCDPYRSCNSKDSSGIDETIEISRNINRSRRKWSTSSSSNHERWEWKLRHSLSYPFDIPWFQNWFFPESKI